jgi:hypothetical protein
VTDHFVPVPLRFFEALTAGDLDPVHLIVGALIAHRCYEVQNTAGGVATVRLATLADLCGVSHDTIQRKVDDLRERGWIDLERPNPGQRIGWRIWLTGLARDAEAEATSARATHELRTSYAPAPPAVRSSSSAEISGNEAATPHGQRDRSSARAPQAKVADPTDETRREEKRRESTTFTEEELEHVLGTTTAAEDNGAGHLFSKEEIAELGKLPLAELRRRHEAGGL